MALILQIVTALIVFSVFAAIGSWIDWLIEQGKLERDRERAWLAWKREQQERSQKP